MERAKFIISEIQENFENYSDKKDATLEVIKLSTIKKPFLRFLFITFKSLVLGRN